MSGAGVRTSYLATQYPGPPTVSPRNFLEAVGRGTCEWGRLRSFLPHLASGQMLTCRNKAQGREGQNVRWSVRSGHDPAPSLTFPGPRARTTEPLPRTCGLRRHPWMMRRRGTVTKGPVAWTRSSVYYIVSPGLRSEDGVSCWYVSRDGLVETEEGKKSRKNRKKKRKKQIKRKEKKKENAKPGQKMSIHAVSMIRQ